jgi:hypothetical protein
MDLRLSNIKMFLSASLSKESFGGGTGVGLGEGLGLGV